jgi:hypothetical protein
MYGISLVGMGIGAFSLLLVLTVEVYTGNLGPFAHFIPLGIFVASWIVQVVDYKRRKKEGSK